MPNVPLVALKRHAYGRQSVTPGQAFEAAERDALLLVRLGIAKRADVGARPEQPIATPPPARPIVEPQTPTPTTVPTEPQAAEPMTTKNITAKRGTYKRRDLTAESDE